MEHARSEETSKPIISFGIVGVYKIEVWSSDEGQENQERE